MRLTNSSGLVAPIIIPVPDISAGETPNTGVVPYTAVTVHARLHGYEQIESRNIQIFPKVRTRLNLEMIPLSELPSAWDKTIIYQTPPQNL